MTTTDAGASAQAHAPSRYPRRARRQDGAVRRLRDAGAVPHRASPPSTRRCASVRACSTSATWASSSSAAPTPSKFVNYVTTNDVAALAVGQVHYSAILNERGTFEDDCLVYRFDDHLMMVVNASNVAKDLAHISQHLDRFEAQHRGRERRDRAARAAGPAGRANSAAAHRRRPVGDQVLPLRGRRRSRAFRTSSSRAPATRAKMASSCTSTTRTRAHIWNALIAGGEVTPAGLGCRDSLRLEMGMALYGNDIDDTVTPLEANLGWIVKLAKGDFVGRDALVRQKEQGIPRKLVGFTTAERAFPRHGYPVVLQRRAERRRVQRNDEPDAQRADRHVLPADGAREAGQRARHRHPRQDREGGGREDAVLQGRVAPLVGNREAGIGNRGHVQCASPF